MSRKDRIKHQLETEFSPSLLEVEDESHTHHVPQNAETHYKILMVTSQFISISRVQRHRLINTVLQNEFNTGMHALSMFLYTPEEWEAAKIVPKSPPCHNGYEDK